MVSASGEPAIMTDTCQSPENPTTPMCDRDMKLKTKPTQRKPR